MTVTQDAPPRARKSRAGRAAEKAAADRPDLKVVPDPEPEAQPSAIDLISARLAQTLGQPADLPRTVVERANGGSAGVPATGENLNEDGTRKGTPQAKAAHAQAKAAQGAAATVQVRTARQKRAAAPKVGQPAKDPDATVQAVPFDRHVGVIQVTTTVKKPRKPPVEETTILARCEHATRNGHITRDAAEKCIKPRLAAFGDTPDAVVGVAVHDRFTGQYTAMAEGSQPVQCPCKFGHKTAESAVACAKQEASRAGLTAA